MKFDKHSLSGREYYFFLVVLLGILLGSCFLKSAPRSSVGTYEYMHWAGTTGFTHSISINGKNVFLEFHPDSDPLAVLTLTNLIPCISNLKENQIFVVGQSDDKIRLSNGFCKGCGPASEYVNFKLSNWYISTPFLEVPPSTCHNEFWGKIRSSRSKLIANDFILNPDELQGVELNRFQK